MKKLLSIICISFLLISTGNAQDLKETLKSLTEVAGKAYVTPVVSAFGANLNTGWMHRVPSAKFFGIDLEFGFIVMGTMFQDENKSFSTQGNFKFNYDQAKEIVQNSGYNPDNAVGKAAITALSNQGATVTLAGPTIVGNKDSSIIATLKDQVVSYGGQSFNIKGKSVDTQIKGFLGELAALPLVVPQVSVGTVYGTSVALRYLPSVKLGDLDFEYFGIGAMHNPGIWFPNPLPVDLAVGFFTQSMDVGGVFSASSTSFGLYASRSFGFSLLNLTPYAGFGFESSEIEVKYTQTINGVPGTTPYTQDITFNLEGANKTRITLGASLKLLAININVDYNISEYNTASAGLGIIF